MSGFKVLHAAVDRARGLFIAALTVIVLTAAMAAPQAAQARAAALPTAFALIAGAAPASLAGDPDVTPPPPPVITYPANGAMVLNARLTIVGTAEANATILLFLDGSIITAFADAAGNWNTSTTPLVATQGLHDVYAQAFDSEGNLSDPSPTTTFTVDSIAPNAPGLTTPVNGSRTSNTTPILSGVAEALSTVTVYINRAAVGTTTADATTAWSLPSPALVDGVYTAYAKATDQAGHTSPGSSTHTFTVDATPPGAPGIVTPADGSRISDTTPTISGTAEAGSTVAVEIDGDPAGTTTANGSGAWTFTASTALTEALHTARATATDATGNVSPSSPASSFTIDATPPTAPLIVTPANGTATTDNTPTISGTAEAAASVTVSLNGAAQTPVTADGSGNWSLTTGALADGAYTVTAIASDTAGNPSPSSSSTSFTVDATPPGAPVIATPVNGSTTGDGTPTISGMAEAGSTVQLTIDGAPVAVVVSAGGAWSYTPPTDLSVGAHTLVAVAVDQTGNTSSASATVAFTYAPLTIVTTSLPGGQVGVSYASSIVVTGGAAPRALALTSGALPTGVALSGTGALSGTPTASGGYAFTVTATDTDGLSISQAYTVAVAVPAPPTAGPTTVQIPAASINAPTTINLSGLIANATGIEIVSPPAHGTLTISGLSAIYQPAPGVFGDIVFSYRAVGFTDGGAGAFSAPSTVTITLAAPTLVLAGGAQPNGQIGVAYSRTLTGAGGTAPYTYAVTAGALPTGVTLAADGTLSGTPTAGGGFSFTVTATDSSTGTGPFNISAVHQLTIDAPAITVTPATLPNAMRGTAYNQAVTASGGVAPYSYSIASGALPAGLTLSTTGQISGVPTVTGSFVFQVRATDSAGGSGPYAGTVNLTLMVNTANLTVTPTSLPDVLAGTTYSQQMQATGGQGGYTFAVTTGALPQGITLSASGALSGRPTTAGTFAFTVTATDGFGNTGAAPLTLKVTARPDPSADPDVRGLNTAQAEATRRLAGAQMTNFNRRLEALHDGAEGQRSVALDLSLNALAPLDETQRTMGELSQVLGRSQGLGLTGTRDQSGREELTRMMAAGRTGDPSAGRLSAGPGSHPAGPSAGPRIWAGGAISLGERDATTQTAELSVTTSGISAGIDMSVSDTLDLGLGVGFGQENTDVGVDVSRMEAETWTGVAYGSWRPVETLFVDGMVGYGQLSFDLRRRTPVNADLVFGEREGTAWFGSLAAGTDRRFGSARFLGYGRLEMVDADLDAFTETGSALWALHYEARGVTSVQGTMGLRYEREIRRGQDRWTPGGRLELRHEFADADSQGLHYADWLDGPGYSIGQEGWGRTQLNLGLSLGFEGRDGLSWSGEYEGGFSDGETMASFRLRLAKRF